MTKIHQVCESGFTRKYNLNFMTSVITIQKLYIALLITFYKQIKIIVLVETLTLKIFLIYFSLSH